MNTSSKMQKVKEFNSVSWLPFQSERSAKKIEYKYTIRKQQIKICYSNGLSQHCFWASSSLALCFGFRRVVGGQSPCSNEGEARESVAI